jgi:pre-mRNA-processing factor 17
MHAPILGPTAPGTHCTMPAGVQNHWSGQVDPSHMNTYVFERQFHSAIQREHEQPQKKQKTSSSKKQGAAEASFDPTAPFVLKSRQPWADKEPEPQPELTEEQKQHAEAHKAGKEAAAAATTGKDYSIFHGKEETDYQGRSWVEPPPTERHGRPDACFIPKRLVHTWTGHTKGVNAIRLFPKTGHLVLSAGLDGKIKIWDVVGDRMVRRTYMGHSKGVRDVWFSNDGRRFVSASYDKEIKYWDTETGQVLGSYGDKNQMAYCVRLHPDQDKQNVLMAGMQNKKILQFDLDSGDIIQQYDYHLGAVNSITFIDENRKFISTSDDKTIRVWEFGIPVQTKYIADPSMHAIAATSATPGGKWWLAQSMENQIHTYSALDKVRRNPKKTFKGHLVAGYACQPNMSPDGRYVISGDGEGKLFVWDWKTTKIVRSLKAHDGVCIGTEWHPLEASKVVTCGWDGLIKLWD